MVELTPIRACKSLLKVFPPLCCFPCHFTMGRMMSSSKLYPLSIDFLKASI